MKNIIKITLVSLAKVALVTIIYALFIVSMIALKTNAAETPRQYEEYEIVKEGIEKEIDQMEEDEDVTVTSIEKHENASEKVCVYVVYISVANDRNYKLYYYLNGETEEVMAVMFTEDGDYVDSETMTLSEAAYLVS